MGSGGEAEKEMIGSRAQAVRDSCPCEALGKTCARRCDNGRVAGQKNVVVFCTHTRRIVPGLSGEVCR